VPIYSLILFLTALLFLGLSIAIYKGKTDLIHSYHQTRVSDRAAYGKAFGKALAVFAAAMLASGLIALGGDALALPAVLVLVVGMAIGFGCIIAVQKKYNGGMF